LRNFELLNCSHKKVIGCLLVIALFPATLFSQTLSGRPLTPGGVMDTAFDRFGNRYPINDLAVKFSSKQLGGAGTISSVSSCTAGMFVVYYANGSGMEIPGNPLHALRRQTVCEVLSNISGLLGYNSNYPNAALVRILVDDVTPYTAPVTPSASGVLGLASAFYAVPWNPASANPGITENVIQKTIKSRVDAWTNITSPVLPVAGNGFYHGYMAFNFSPVVSWNSGISGLATANQFDLYTVILHEITHALGFASLIGKSGISKLGASNNYYSTFDTYLNYVAPNNTLVPLLTSTNSCYPDYGLTFTASPGVLAPGCPTTYTSDITFCPTAIRYKSALIGNMPVYTPGCFENGSSLSHFEDMCYPSNTPSNNNQYFTMSNANGPGTNKRYLQAEEKNVLCNLGYTVINTFSSNAVAASYTYTGGTCSNSPVWGINDGLSNTGFLFTSGGGTVSIPITGTAGIVANDYQGSNPVTTVVCVESVYNNGIAAISGTDIIFTPANNSGGIFVIRYIPVNSLGARGNITYIFGFVYPSFCGSVTPCDMVQNGSFENNSGCGSMPIGSSTLASCWLVSSLTPDIFVRNCVTPGTVQANLGINTYSSSTVFDSFNGGANNAVAGFAGFTGSSDLFLSESLTNYLGTPVSNNQAYTLSFWAFQFSGTKYDPQALFMGNQAFNTASISAVLSFAISNLYTPASFSVSNYPYPPLTVIKSVTLANVFNTWRHYSCTFTPFAISTGNWLYVGMDKSLTYANVINAVGQSSANDLGFYTLIDDVSLRPANQAPQLKMPSHICLGQSLPDLGQYVNTPGGIFSGPGVTTTVVSGSSGTVTQYNFNAAQTLAAGIYNIIYTYTDNIQCIQTAIQQVKIGNQFNGVVLAYGATTNCVNAGTLSVVSPTAAYNYTWQPGNITGNVFTVSPNVITMYSVIGNNSSTCIATGSISVSPNKAYAQLVADPQQSCPGDLTQITAIGNYTSITWQPGNYTTGVIHVPSGPTSYTALVTSAIGCTATVSTTVLVGTTPTISISVSNSLICPGQAWTLTASGALNYYWSNNSSSSSVIVVYPSVPTCYTVTGRGSGSGYCAATATVMLNVVTTSAAASGYEVCAGQPVTLTAQSGALTYTWMPGNIYGQVITVTPQTTTTYTLYASYSFNPALCTATSTLQVIVDPCTEIIESKTDGQKLIVFPNPNDGSFIIDSETHGYFEIKIYNELGQVVRSLQLSDVVGRKLVITDLPAGFYLIESCEKRARLIIVDR
jgi:hypothetical protein